MREEKRTSHKQFVFHKKRETEILPYLSLLLLFVSANLLPEIIWWCECVLWEEEWVVVVGADVFSIQRGSLAVVQTDILCVGRDLVERAHSHTHTHTHTHAHTTFSLHRLQETHRYTHTNGTEIHTHTHTHTHTHEPTHPHIQRAQLFRVVVRYWSHHSPPAMQLSGIQNWWEINQYKCSGPGSVLYLRAPACTAEPQLVYTALYVHVII